MVIVYGFGAHAKRLFDTYDVPLMEIEAVIDKKCQTVFDGKYKCISWDDFSESRDKYISDTIIIGTVDYEKEIRKKIINSGLFSDQKILHIDSWIRMYPKSVGLKKMQQQMNAVGTIDKELLKNARVLASRDDALSVMPRNMVVAEVGVAFGNFSRKILDNMHPTKFYALDIFTNKKGFWNNNLFEEANLTHYEWYKNRFSKEVAEGIVELRKGYSWECLGQFPDNFFDYVYLDAAHDYESVRKDVEVLKRVVKAGGIIQFNDYIYCDYISDMFYGIMPVVNKLVNDTRSEVLYYCLSVNGFDDIVVKLNK